MGVASTADAESIPTTSKATAKPNAEVRRIAPLCCMMQIPPASRIEFGRSSVVPNPAQVSPESHPKRVLSRPQRNVYLSQRESPSGAGGHALVRYVEFQVDRNWVCGS